MTKKLNPINNSRRNTNLIDYRKKLVYSNKETPRNLLEINKKHSGRNNQGLITTRHQGGRNKRFYRIIDFKRYQKDEIKGKIKSIEYDPNRNCFISLVSFLDGSFSYIISPEGIKVGDEVISSDKENIPINIGNNLPLKFIPANTHIHNLEIKPNKGGQLIRGAGTCGEIIGKDKDPRYVLVKLASKEVRRVLANCRATIGKVSNGEVNLVRKGKAGALR